jgi:hypothetical protein
MLPNVALDITSSEPSPVEECIRLYIATLMYTLPYQIFCSAALKLSNRD